MNDISNKNRIPKPTVLKDMPSLPSNTHTYTHTFTHTNTHTHTGHAAHLLPQLATGQLLKDKNPTPTSTTCPPPPKVLRGPFSLAVFTTVW